MKREDIALNDTWDLSLLYVNSQQFEQDLTQAQTLLNTIIQQQGHLCDTLDHFKSYLRQDEQLDRLLSKLYCFAHLLCDVEPNNAQGQTMLAQVMSLYQQAQEKLTFVELELMDHETMILDYLKDPHLENYQYKMHTLFRQKEHILSKEMEDILAKVNQIANTGEDVFDALRLEFEPVEVHGKMEFLNQATLNQFLKNEDPRVRKEAYEHFFKEYQRYENVFASTLSSTMKKDAFFASMRHFDHALQASLFQDDVPESLFFKILDMANRQYRPLFHRYNAFKKKYLQLENMYNYDLSVPLVKEKEHHYTIDECFDIILKTVEVFGSEYVNIIQKAKNERWIDYYPCVGKRDGAYSSGCYDSVPYILTNFIGDYHSLSTLIHELGHSVHTYLSNAYQAPHNASYRIFVAEVPSTLNELLLMQYMLDHASSKQEKAYLLYTLLEECVGLIFRQPMFADFEYRLHTMAEKNQPMSSKIITDLYLKLNQDYYGPDVKMSPYVGCSCYYVPHFYYNYYVYKYTLGMTIALALAERILKKDQQQIDRYLSFLKSGGSMSNLDLLKKAGVDPLDDQLYQDAYHYFETTLSQLEDMMKEV